MTPTLSIHRLAVFFMAILASCGSSLADFDFQLGTHAYRVVTSPASWLDAATAAAEIVRPGYVSGLAVIESSEENQLIFEQLVAGISEAEFSRTLAPDGGGGAYVWLAATDRETEGEWIWDTNGDGLGEPFWLGTKTGNSVDDAYQNWGRLNRQNEPDNFRNLQDGGAISINGWPLGNSGQWNDVVDANQLDYLVEFTPARRGDFDESGRFDAADINLLSRAVNSGSTDLRFDLDGNGVLDQEDRTRWVSQIAETFFGDANLDAEFNSTDIVNVFSSGEYEDNVSANSTWQTGDWNGDLEFDTGDLVRAIQNGGANKRH